MNTPYSTTGRADKRCAKKNKTLPSDQAFPDSSKIKFMFADINDDKKLDGLVTFGRQCCACTVPVGMPQSQILILSNENGYAITDSFFVDIYKNMKGNIYIDSISTDKFFGTLDKYVTRDSVMYSSLDTTKSDTFKIKTFSVIYKTRQFKITGQRNIVDTSSAIDSSRQTTTLLTGKK